MTSKDIKLIKEMLQMQAKLDEAIMKEYGLTEIDKKNLGFAILDEVGELTHELKGDWCWWKKSQAPVEELRAEEQMIENAKIYFCEIKVFKTGIIYLLADLTSINSNKLERLIAITEYLGFTIEDVYQAYCGKNKINYQRLKEGY